MPQCQCPPAEVVPPCPPAPAAEVLQFPPALPSVAPKLDSPAQQLPLRLVPRLLGRSEWATALLQEPTASASFVRMAVPVEGGRSAAFFYAVEDTLHSADFIVKHEAANVGVWARSVQRAVGADGSGPCFALDVGSNGGYFSLLARALGCNVLAVDAQPRCLERLASSAAVSGFTSGLTVRWGAVSDDPALRLEVGATRCSGLWGVTEESSYITNESTRSVVAAGLPLQPLVEAWLAVEGAVVNASVAVFKIDVEGSEVAVLRSALWLIEAHRVGVVILEVVPARVDPITPWEAVRDTFERLYTAGYACGLAASWGSAPHYFSLQDLLRYFDPASTSKRAGLSPYWQCGRPGDAAL